MKKYLFENNSLFLNQAGLRVLSFGKQTSSCKLPFNSAPKRIYNNYVICFLIKGKGLIESKNYPSQLINEGCFFILLPEIWYRYGPIKNNKWEEYFFHADGFILDKYRQLGFLNIQQPFIKSCNTRQTILIFKRMETLAQKKENRFLNELSIEAYAVLQQILVSITETKKIIEDSKLVLIKKILTQINNNKNTPISIKKICSSENYCYSYIRKLFREYTGYSPENYYILLKIDSAKELLIYTNLRIKEIAAAIGYDDSLYFSRLFKKKTGVSPLAYKAKTEIEKPFKNNRMFIKNQ